MCNQVRRHYAVRRKLDVFAVYAEIDDDCGPKLHTWYRQEVLAVRLNMSPRTLQRKLDTLYADGFLRKRQYSGDRTINDYCLAKVEALLGVEAGDDKLVVQNTTAGVAFSPPHLLTEPVQEPCQSDARLTDEVTVVIPTAPSAPSVVAADYANRSELKRTETNRSELKRTLEAAESEMDAAGREAITRSLEAFDRIPGVTILDNGQPWNPRSRTIEDAVIKAGARFGASRFAIAAYLGNRWAWASRSRFGLPTSPGWFVAVVRNHFAPPIDAPPPTQPRPPQAAPVVVPAESYGPDMGFVHDTLARLASIGRIA